MSSRPDSGRDLVLQSLSSIGGVAALLVGGLYLAGLLIKAAALDEAGLTVRDSLPLFSLEQILRTGLTLVIPALIVFAILAIVFAFLSGWENRLKRLAAEFRAEEEPFQSDAERETWCSNLLSAESRTDWEPVREAIQRALRSARTSGSDRAGKLRDRLWEFRAFEVTGTVVVLLAVAAAAFYLPVEFAVPFFLIAFLTLALIGVRRIEYQLASLYAVIVGALVVSSLVFPPPLPMAILVTDTEGKVEGELVVRAESTWYLKAGKGEIRSISAADVDCSRVISRDRSMKRLWEQLVFPVDVPREQDVAIECNPQGTDRRNSR